MALVKNFILNKIHHIMLSKVPHKGIYIWLLNFVRKTSNKFRLLPLFIIVSMACLKMLLKSMTFHGHCPLLEQRTGCAALGFPVQGLTLDLKMSLPASSSAYT